MVAKQPKCPDLGTNPDSCPHCKGGEETFGYFGGMYLFDVDMARELVADGRQPVELEPEDVAFSVDNSRIHLQHLAHVDLKYPGIIAHYWYTTPDGEELVGHVLIDGHHRAARALQEGVPFWVYLLTADESRQILLQAPSLDKPVV